MAKSAIMKEKKIRKGILKRIEEFKSELVKNDDIFRKNSEETRKQIQMGLYRNGYPRGSPMYDSLLEKMELEQEESEIMLSSGFKSVNPRFEFETSPRWIEIQTIFHQKKVEAIKGNMQEIRKNVELVQREIAEQNERIKSRRIQIIEELKSLGQDVSEFEDKPASYIG